MKKGTRVRVLRTNEIGTIAENNSSERTDRRKYIAMCD